VNVDTSRNWGFVTADEQRRLASLRVAVAGCGGDGGLVVETLVRLGVRSFALADPETFAIENLNRQNGCDVTTLGRPKAEVLAELVQRIAPSAAVEVYPEGVTAGNVEAFVQGADVVVDEIEYTRPDVAICLARAARRRGLPVVSGLNVGFGCLVSTFLPAGTTLERCLGVHERTSLEELRAVPVPLRRWVPRLPSYIDAATLRAVEQGEVSAPSVAPGVALAAGLVTSEVFAVVTGRRPAVTAPGAYWTDALSLRSRRIRFPAASYTGSVLRIAVRTALGRNPAVTLPARVPELTGQELR
jgi:molybdopterin/thiamine biosynthesis adenylyltransferase